jgi:hypothetical protein
MFKLEAKIMLKRKMIYNIFQNQYIHMYVYGQGPQYLDGCGDSTDNE